MFRPILPTEKRATNATGSHYGVTPCSYRGKVRASQNFMIIHNLGKMVRKVYFPNFPKTPIFENKTAKSITRHFLACFCLSNFNLEQGLAGGQK